MTWETQSTSLKDTLRLGEAVGKRLKGGEVIELISDLGGGKTAFVRGLAKGAGSNDDVASPTFTISRIYRGPRADIHHYDFYRLNESGIVGQELEESLEDKRAVTVVEWGQTVRDILPKSRLAVTITATGEDSRQFAFSAPASHAYLVEGL